MLSPWIIRTLTLPPLRASLIPCTFCRYHTPTIYLPQNSYGNAIIGRYGGCFEEDIRRLMCDRAYHIMGFGCTSEVCTDNRGEKGQCTVPKRLENCEKVRVRIIHGLNISHKELTYLLHKSTSRQNPRHYAHAPRGIDW